MNRLYFAVIAGIVLLVLLVPAGLQRPTIQYADSLREEGHVPPAIEFTDGSQVSGNGIVSVILEDDLYGDRHQRFILRLPSGNTLLIAHNIDLAPKIQTIRIGDVVEFYGVYEWNERGGVVHWTHHDPAGRRQGGWLKHNGQLYQ